MNDNAGSSPPGGHRSQFALLGTRRFAPFFVTQFLGAFNDNLFKNALVVLLTFQAVSWTTLAPELLANLAAGIFILPFFLFSATAGQLADKYDKATLARVVKVLEMAIMAIAALGFHWHSLNLLLGALFLLGLHSTLFGPVKYAILPQHLCEDELVGGNALIESGTFVAILLGTLAGGILAGSGEHPAWMAGAGFAVAAAGFISSLGVPSAPAPAPGLRVNLNPFSETWRNIRLARRERSVFLSILGISWFWLYGAMFLAQFPVYAKNVLGGGESTVTLLLAVFTVGIGVGSMLCDRLSGGHIELGLVPFGSIGLTLFGFDLLFSSPTLPAGSVPLDLATLLSAPGIWRVLIDLLGLGMFGGFFIVPLYVLIQMRGAAEERARIIAANNIMNALFMVLGAGGAAALLAAGLSMPALFALAAVLNALVALYIYRLLPEFLLRFVAWLLVHSVYRLDTRGVEHLPADGAAVLVCNHVSFVDPIIIAAACRRPIRFVMDHRIHRTPLIGFIFRHMRTIPIAPASEDAALKEAAFAEVARALAEGDLVCIFPEGRITDSGELYPFRNGIARILADTPVPVIPMALTGLWGSFFSRKGGRAMNNPLHLRPFLRVGLAVAPALNPEAATPEALQAEVATLRGDRR